MTSPAPEPAPGRRARRTRETFDDIKAAGLRQLGETGSPTGVSMRGIARHLGMTASAVHYYYESREDLLDALVVDGFEALTALLRSTSSQTADLDTDDRWLALATTFRGWALDHPAHYLLIYGRTGGAKARLSAPVGEALGGLVAVLFDLMRDTQNHQRLDRRGLEASIPASMRPHLEAWRTATPGIADLSDAALVACMLCYSRLHGAIALELVGHIPPALQDRDSLFALQMRHTADAIDFRG